MSKQVEQYTDYVSRLFPELSGFDNNGNKLLTRTVTFQVTDDCNLACSYCYQINKGKRKLKFETAKKLIDNLLADTMDYCNKDNSPGIIIEFIGGEPFMEVELMDQITDYFRAKSVELMHPWAEKFRISISSNGTLYFDEKVQNYLNKNKNRMSLNITIDGDKELHDSCRVFPNGTGSYDIAHAAAMDWKSKGNYLGSKITICPENLEYMNKAIRYFITNGYTEIHANTVYEEGWTIEHAKVFYNQLKYLAQHLLETGLYQTTYISLFNSAFFKPMPEDENENWCGGTGLMLAVDPDGYYYPCIRYMESSLGTDQPPIRIGHVDDGIGCSKEYADNIECLNCITRRSQSTDECFYCPIASGCAWCSGYNYQVYGTPNKRATFSCDMHKARALANVYYWNTQGIHLDNNCPKEWALEIISEEEYEMLNQLADSTRE